MTRADMDVLINRVSLSNCKKQTAISSHRYRTTMVIEKRTQRLEQRFLTSDQRHLLRL